MIVAIVIPAYNEAATIAGVVDSVSPHGMPIVVDDCSTDDTGTYALAAGAEVVRHQINHGYDGAIESGFSRAAELGAEIVVTFDADGQHDAGILTRILAPFTIANIDIDMVIGVRPGFARFSERLFGLYTQLRYGLPDILCGLKAYRIELYQNQGHFDSSRSIGTELALAGLRQGVRWQSVMVPIQARQDESRFGSLLQANLRILRALALAIWADFSTLGVKRSRWERPLA